MQIEGPGVVETRPAVGEVFGEPCVLRLKCTACLRLVIAVGVESVDRAGADELDNAHTPFLVDDACAREVI